MLSVIIFHQNADPASHSKQLSVVHTFNCEPQPHGLKYTQQISVGNNYDVIR